MPKRLVVTQQQAGDRLDHLLAEALGISHGEVRRLIAQQLVTLDGRPAAKGAKPAAGQAVEVLADISGRIIANAQLSVPVIARGPGWLMVNKPAGMAVHPLRHDERDTVLNAVAANDPQVQGVGEGGLRSGVVHRLDVTTTGCLVLATQQDVWQRLRDAFASHQARKTYLAVVEGRLDEPGELRVQLAVTQHRPARVQVVSEGGRWCDLRWTVQQVGDRASVVEIDLGTGFLHQVRVMLAHLGHPLVGDPWYGGSVPAARPLLHARRLEAEEASGTAPPPRDMLPWLPVSI